MTKRRIDFHSHILPGIDDGSRDEEMSRVLLCQEMDQGVSTVVATPHFYAEKSSVDRFLQRRADAYRKVLPLLKELCEEKNAQAPRIIPGAEVYYFPGMSKAERLSDLCLVGSSILLLELPFAQWTEAIYQEVRDLIRERHFTVILAHIERFYPYQKDMRYLKAILELPVILQVNAGGFPERKDRKLLIKIHQEGRFMILGSDTHSPHRRPVNIEAGLTLMDEVLGEGSGERMMAVAAALLSQRRR